MGKKRIITTQAAPAGTGTLGSGETRLARKKIAKGRVYIQSTYNNTLMSLADPVGNIIASSSAGSVGFKGTQKGTPFAAGRVGDLMAEKAVNSGLKEVEIYISGVGAGRESALRSFAAKSGAVITAIRDVTPLPHNGPRPPKPRRV